MGSTRHGLRSTTLLVVASMVGTGVFTTSGFLLRDLGSSWLVLAVWVVGGVVALAGALSYAELASGGAESGGEYVLVGRSIHPALGFCAGIVSIVAGFAAPIAACAIAFGQYLDAIVPGTPVVPVASVLVIVASLVHGIAPRFGALVQDGATFAKIVLAFAFALGGAMKADFGRLAIEVEPSGTMSIGSAFAVGLVYVYFAYTGWNAAAYVAGEIDRPRWTIPRSLALGTFAVTILYVGLNAVFLAAAPAEELVGRVEVGHVAATHLFGPWGGRVLSGIIAFGLVSTVGAFAVTGARVYQAIGRDHPRLRVLARTNDAGAPTVGLAIQAVLALGMVWTAAFDVLLGAIGFTLSISAAATVIGLFIERKRRGGPPASFAVPLYPWTPLVFVLAMAWTVVQSVIDAPIIAIAGVLTIAVGIGSYGVLVYLDRRA